MGIQEKANSSIDWGSNKKIVTLIFFLIKMLCVDFPLFLVGCAQLISITTSKNILLHILLFVILFNLCKIILYYVLWYQN